MTTIANYYRQLQESMKESQVKEETPRNVKSKLIHAFGDKLSFFQKSSKTGKTVYYDIDYREKVFFFFLTRRKLKKLGSLLKVKLKNFP